MADSLRPLLVTRQQAAYHIRRPDLAGDEGSPNDSPEGRDLTLKLETAQQMILDYLKDRADESWEDPSTTPPLIQGVILMQFGELWRFRGDDPGSIDSAPKYEDGQLSVIVTAMLRRRRDPALA